MATSNVINLNELKGDFFEAFQKGDTIKSSDNRVSAYRGLNGEIYTISVIGEEFLKLFRENSLAITGDSPFTSDARTNVFFGKTGTDETYRASLNAVGALTVSSLDIELTKQVQTMSLHVEVRVAVKRVENEDEAAVSEKQALELLKSIMPQVEKKMIEIVPESKKNVKGRYKEGRAGAWA